MIVLDASATVELLLNTATGGRVAARIAPPAVTLHTPHLLDPEVAQVLRRYVHAGQLGADRARAALGALAQLDVTRYPHDDLLPRIWALRDNMTAYDACYVALAEALDAPLLTTDKKLAAAPGTVVSIEVVPTR